MSSNKLNNKDKLTLVRENPWWWLFKTLISLLIICGIVQLLSIWLPEMIPLWMILGGLTCFISFCYSMYMLIFADLYICKYCGARFHINFFEKIYKFSNQVEHWGYEKRLDPEYRWWRKVRCPKCGNKIEFKSSVLDDKTINNLNVYDVLNYLEIRYDEIEHEKVVTVEEAIKVSSSIDGFGTKSLFLTDGNRYYLVVLSEFKKANMKALAKLVGCKDLSFAKKWDLSSTLKLEEGSVTPLGIINDKYKEVMVLIDKDLINCKILVHPNINTKTISITCADLIRYIEYLEHEYIIF